MITTYFLMYTSEKFLLSEKNFWGGGWRFREKKVIGLIKTQIMTKILKKGKILSLSSK